MNYNCHLIYIFQSFMRVNYVKLKILCHVQMLLLQSKMMSTKQIEYLITELYVTNINILYHL